MARPESIRCRSVAVVAAATAGLAMSWTGSAGAATLAHTHSPSFAGYEITVVPTTATAAFKLPVLVCTSVNGGIVPSLDFTNFTTGEFTGVGVFVQCINGTPTYGALAEINDRFSYLSQTLNPGDAIRVSLSTSASRTTVTVADTTRKSAVKDSVFGPGGGGSFTGFSVGDSTIGSPSEPIVQFGKLTIGQAKVNGLSLAAAGPNSISDLYSGSTLQIRTGALSASGTSFATTFVHT